jgi:uncharacterized membrane protein (UPF0127 family)
MRLVLLVTVGLLLLAGCGGLVQEDSPSVCEGLATTGDEYDDAVVTFSSPDGSTLGSVDARVADSPREQCIGLSRTDDLDADEGMVFVFQETAERTFVMREMAFPLDIIFVDGNGTITQISSAPTEDPPLTEYQAEARYVVEVPRGWAAQNGVEVGDEVHVALGED